MTKSTFINLISEENIEIPVIQRDYVQGRGNTVEELDKRESFADRLIGALDKSLSSCNLEFIYGAKNKDTNTFVPLDGQQRLTTLFLLHWVIWYKSSDAARRNFRIEDLKKFSYETRLSSANFCKALIEKGICVSDDGKRLKELIENQPWFSEDWRYDPTISAMLSMIDCLDERIKTYSQEDIDFMLENTGAITFDEIEMTQYGLTDALYIKMNARGKQLTKFENWKSDFIRYLKENVVNNIFEARDFARNAITGSYKDYFSHSIEHEWTDLFWTYLKPVAKDILGSSDLKKLSHYPMIDELFMNFLDCLCKYWYYIQVENTTDFDEISMQKKRAVWQNRDFIDFFMRSLDSMCRIPEHERFFEELFYDSDEEIPASFSNGKVRLFRTKNKNLFKLCIEKGATMELTDQLLFISLLKYCNKFRISEVDNSMKAYMRKIRNYFESLLQHNKTRTAVQLDLRTDNFATYDAFIESLINKTSDNLSPSVEICRIEDCSFIRGNITVFEDSIRNFGDKTTADTLAEFCNCDDLQRIRLLISCGYNGTVLGYCIGRKRYFFGNNQRGVQKWDVPFISDAGNIAKAFSELTGKYQAGKTTDEIVLDAMQTVQKGSFAYYMLKYDSFANANSYRYHFAVKGDIDDVDLIALGSYSSNPGMAYHTDPLAVVVMEMIKEKFSDAKLSVYGIYSNKCPLTIIKDNKEYFSIISNKDGWSITVGQNLITEEMRDNFHIVTVENGNLLVPKSQMEKDMIETGVDVLKAILS